MEFTPTLPPNDDDNIRTKLVIDLDEGEDTQDLKTLLNLNSTTGTCTRRHITKVRVESSFSCCFCWDDVDSSSSMEDQDLVEKKKLSRIFVHLGQLENLQQLHLNLASGMSLCMFLLAKVLEQSPRLQMLCLDSMILLSTVEEEISSHLMLGHVVKGHQALTCVCLSDIQVVVQRPTTTYNSAVALPENNGEEEMSMAGQAIQLEPFLVSLVQDCPKMRVLELEDVPTSTTSLRAIASSSSCQLEDVELWNIPTVCEHVESLAGALQTNNNNTTTIEKLELCQCSIGPQGGQQLTNMLLRNTSLTSVVLDIDWGVHTMFAQPIASILRSNCTLVHLHFICRQQQQPPPPPEEQHSMGTTTRTATRAEDYAQMICSSLTQNNTLQRLALEFRQARTYRNDNSRLTAAFTEPLRQALMGPQNKNCTLQEFTLMGGSSILPVVWRKDIAFYLALNKAGRKDWMSTISSPFASRTNNENHHWWIDTLIQHKNDVNICYYFMSLHPHLISCSGAQETSYR